MGSHITTPWAERQLRTVALVIVAVNLVVPGAMLGYALVTDTAFWRLFRGEEHLVDWFSSLQLLLLSLVAFANFQLDGIARRLGAVDVARHRGVWLVFAMGFVLLALDEQFNLHEAVRNNVFRPSGVFTDVKWMVSGDIGLYLVFIAGVGCAVLLRDQLRLARHARVLFIAALLMAFPAIVIDSLRDSAMAGWPLRRFLDYTFEEVAEIWAELLLLLSFLAVLAWRAGTLHELEETGR